LPATGALDQLHLSARVRVDSGVAQGDVISPFYDPMIAKLIAHGPTREAARSALLTALDDSFVAPLRTNQGFLFECLADPDFAAGTVDTGLIERRGAALIPPAEPSQSAADAAAQVLRGGQTGLFGLRLNRDPETRIALWADGHLRYGDSAAQGDLPGAILCGDAAIVTERGQSRVFAAQPPRPRAGAAAGDGAILAPMPGKVIAVDVAAGDSVTKGQRLAVLEAMKMEHALTAPFDGTVAELAATPGAQVQVETLLIRIEPREA
ncbi:MAG: hypothetical protein RLZZ84_1165, partial [Pseudomonadota bacterium]